LTQGDTPWDPSSFYNQVADVFYKQVIDTESYNSNGIKLFPYDPSDTYENSILGKSAILTFCPKMMMKIQVAHAIPVVKHYLVTLIMKDFHLILHLGYMM
jgi:hypothetical protein